MSIIGLENDLALLTLKGFVPRVLKPHDGDDTFITSLKKFLRSKGIDVKSFLYTETRDYEITIDSVNVDLTQIKRQNEFLKDVAEFIGFSQVWQVQETFSKLGGIVKYNQFDKGGEFSTYSWDERIDPQLHIGVSQLLDMTDKYYRSGILSEKHTTVRKFGSVSFIKTENNAVEVIHGQKLVEWGFESATPIIEQIWKEAEKYVNSLSFIECRLGQIRLDIDLENKKLFFSVVGSSKGFNTSKFNVTNKFLGIERQFSKFKNSVFVEQFK